MSSFTVPLTELRTDLIDALPADVAQESERTPPNQLYLPWSHRKALRLESSLVIGARGVGKSVWNQALQDLAQRERNEILGTLFPYPLQVKPGFGTASKPASYPPLKTFDDPEAGLPAPRRLASGALPRPCHNHAARQVSKHPR